MRSIHRARKEREREEGKRNIREFRPRFRSRFRFAAARILKSSFAPRTIETRRTNAWPISRKAWRTTHHYHLLLLLVPWHTHDVREDVSLTFSSHHFTNRPIHKDKRRRGGGSRFVARGWRSTRLLIEREREREEPDGTRNGAISRRLHSDKGLNALMDRPIETSHLTSSASALVALYGLPLFASTSEHRPDRYPFRYPSPSLSPSSLSTNLKDGKLKSKKEEERESLV